MGSTKLPQAPLVLSVFFLFDHSMRSPDANTPVWIGFNAGFSGNPKWLITLMFRRLIEHNISMHHVSNNLNSLIVNENFKDEVYE